MSKQWKKAGICNTLKDGELICGFHVMVDDGARIRVTLEENVHEGTYKNRPWPSPDSGNWPGFVDEGGDWYPIYSHSHQIEVLL